MMGTLRCLLSGAAIAALVWGSALATIRINGNQMVEASALLLSAADRQKQAGEASAAAPRKLVYNSGQAIMSRGDLPGPAAGGGTIAFAIGIGLGYDIAHVAYNLFCPVDKTGDVNNTGVINSADIVHLVNYVFKSGPRPVPCRASGDVNCSGAVTSADIIFLVNYVFKSGPAPCDVCNLYPNVWSCP